MSTITASHGRWKWEHKDSDDKVISIAFNWDTSSPTRDIMSCVTYRDPLCVFNVIEGLYDTEFSYNGWLIDPGETLIRLSQFEDNDLKTIDDLEARNLVAVTASEY